MNTMLRKTTGWGILAMLATFLLLAGCGRSAPISYYQLSPVRGEEPAGAATAAGDMVIGIGPVRLREHLDRQQLISHTTANRLQLADSHRWAEPLAANIAWVLRDNLSALLATEHLLIHPWERTSPVNFQVSLEILHCEGAADGSAQLEALWAVTDREGRELLPPRRGSYQIPPATQDKEGLVSALSQAMSSLSRDIAREILKLHAKAPRQQP